jgi:hypothetical protein
VRRLVSFRAGVLIRRVAAMLKIDRIPAVMGQWAAERAPAGRTPGPSPMPVDHLRTYAEK